MASVTFYFPGNADSGHFSHLIHSMASWTVLAEKERTINSCRSEQLLKLLGAGISYLNLLQRQMSPVTNS